MTADRLHHPVQQNERIAIIDSLRGFALLGVLIANLHAIVQYTTPADMLAKIILPADDVLYSIQHWFIEGKFVTLFAMLFGYGFGLLLQRLEAKGTPVTVFFARRMGILIALGFVNLCLWWADILHVYALAGLALLLFRRASDRAVLVTAISFVFGLTWLSFAFSKTVFGAGFDATMSQTLFPLFKSSDPLDMVHGNYALSQMFNATGQIMYILLHPMGCILFGYWVLRKDLFGRLEQHLRSVKKLWWTGLVCFAIPVCFTCMGKAGWFENPWIYYTIFPLFQAGVIGISLFYSSSLVLLHRKGILQGLFRAFSHVGRLSLTNYLMQSVLFVVFFYGVGFNQLGEVAYRHIWVLGVSFYLLQVAFSAWWMKRYHYGPVEWLWRQLSYGRRFPIRRAVAGVTFTP